MTELFDELEKYCDKHHVKLQIDENPRDKNRFEITLDNFVYEELRDIRGIIYDYAKIEDDVHLAGNGRAIDISLEESKKSARKSIKESEYEDYVNLDNLHFGYNDEYGFMEFKFYKNIQIKHDNGYTIIFGQLPSKEWAFAITDVSKGEGNLIDCIVNFVKKDTLVDLNNALKNLGIDKTWNELSESKKSSRKSIEESRQSILDKRFYELVDEGYIYDEDEDGMNMSYGELVAVSDDLWETLEDELKYYDDFQEAYDVYMDIMDNTSDDTKMFMTGLDEYFYFDINEDEGTYSVDGEIPFILEKLFKKFQKETDFERV